MKIKLDKRFGKPHTLKYIFPSSNSGPLRKEHDGEALEELADFLELCKTAMTKLPVLRCLNERRENENTLLKLQFSIGNRWVKMAATIEAKTMKFPSLFDFTHFLANEADVAGNRCEQLHSRIGLIKNKL